jgi:hypothetical protein
VSTAIRIGAPLFARIRAGLCAFSLSRPSYSRTSCFGYSGLRTKKGPWHNHCSGVLPMFARHMVWLWLLLIGAVIVVLSILVISISTSPR